MCLMYVNVDVLVLFVCSVFLIFLVFCGKMFFVVESVYTIASLILFSAFSRFVVCNRFIIDGLLFLLMSKFFFMV